MPGQWCRNFLQMLLFSPHLIPLSFSSLLFTVVSAEGVKSLREPTPFYDENPRLWQLPENPRAIQRVTRVKAIGSSSESVQ